MATYTGLHILGAIRLNNSFYGNPRFRVEFDGDLGTAITQSDASCNYDVENFTHSRHAGDTFTVKTSRAGRITHITLEK